MERGIVIYHRTMGVYLGSCMGFGFWSKMDNAGQDAAITFANREMAESVIAAWDEPVDACTFVEVEIDSGMQYASIASCVRAGLPAWEPWRPVQH